MKKTIFALLVLFVLFVNNYAFSESEKKESYIPINYLIEEINRVKRIVTEQQCSASTAKMLEYLTGLYAALSYQSSQISSPENNYEDFFLIYAKLGYIYSLSNDSVQSEYFFYKAKQYGVKIDKRLENKDFLISEMKKAKLYCVVKPVTSK